MVQNLKISNCPVMRKQEVRWLTHKWCCSPFALDPVGLPLMKKTQLLTTQALEPHRPVFELPF